ncbi:MAG: serine protease [Candidatus Methylomirabilis sp.]|nr:serine protease [Candidatus Methylomirabilis sp.]
MIPTKRVVSQKRTPKATVFFVCVPFEEGAFIYAVTARHVIDSARPYDRFYVRVNTKDGAFEDVETQASGWFCHPTTDVAAIPVNLPQKNYDLLPLPCSMLLTTEIVAKRKVGVGDDVIAVGLYSKYFGVTRNQPIVRFGHVALMPDEQIPLKLYPGESGQPVLGDAYLLELQSWGGQSGSPVFVYYPADRELNRLKVRGAGPELLGLIHGHHDLDKKVKFTGDFPGTAKVPLNAGIAILIPSQKINELLMGDELLEDRKRRYQDHKAQQLATTPDCAVSDQPSPKM